MSALWQIYVRAGRSGNQRQRTHCEFRPGTLKRSCVKFGLAASGPRRHLRVQGVGVATSWLYAADGQLNGLFGMGTFLFERNARLFQSFVFSSYVDVIN